MNEGQRQLAEIAARLISAKAAEMQDANPGGSIQLLAQAFLELRDQVRNLHDLVDLTDPNDPIGTALTKVGLEVRPRDRSDHPHLVPKEPVASITDSDELLKIYLRVMHESKEAFTKHESFIVRAWDGMDGCWTDVTGAVDRSTALSVWAERTRNGTKHVSYAEIDYFRIFPGSTHMLWDGSDGRELNR